jgi:hypothetical protein
MNLAGTVHWASSLRVREEKERHGSLFSSFPTEVAMFLEGVKFGVGWIVGTGAILSAIIGVFALTEWVKNRWIKERERSRQEPVEYEEPRKLLDRAELAIVRRGRTPVLLMRKTEHPHFRTPLSQDEPVESASTRTRYIQ